MLYRVYTGSATGTIIINENSKENIGKTNRAGFWGYFRQEISCRKGLTAKVMQDAM